MIYGRNRQGRLFQVWYESVLWLQMASPNYSFQRTVMFSEIQSRLRLRTAITWEKHAPLAMLNYSPL